jgi:hypothetical protein
MDTMNINKKVEEKAPDTKMKLSKEIVDNDLLGLDDDNIFVEELYWDIV